MRRPTNHGAAIHTTDSSKECLYTSSGCQLCRNKIFNIFSSLTLIHEKILFFSFSFLSTSSSSHNRDSRQHHYFNFGFVVIPDVIIKAPPKPRLALFDDETARHEQQLLKGQTSANNFVTNAFIKAHFFTFIGTFIASMDEPV